MLNNLEITAKGHVQVKTEQERALFVNSRQTPSLCSPPGLPIGPPIQRI